MQIDLYNGCKTVVCVHVKDKFVVAHSQITNILVASFQAVEARVITIDDCHANVCRFRFFDQSWFWIYLKLCFKTVFLARPCFIFTFGHI